MEDISKKIEDFQKCLKEQLEWQLGNVSDKVYYDVKDSTSQVNNQITSVANAIEQQVNVDIEKGNIDQKILAQVKNDVIKQMVEQIINEYKHEIEDLRNKTNQLINKITNDIISKLKNY